METQRKEEYNNFIFYETSHIEKSAVALLDFSKSFTSSKFILG